MTRLDRPVRSGWTKPLFLVIVGALIGLGVGRWVLAPRAAAEKKWQDLNELQQMVLAPSGFNFVESNKSYENQLMDLIHDRLLHYDPVRDELAAGLARTYEESPDGLTWTFHLRPAQTPDGLKLNAEDVVFSFNLCLDTRFDCKKRGNFVINKQPVAASAADAETVVFRLAEPFHSFPWALAQMFVAPKATFAAVAGNETDFRHAVGVQAPETKYLRGFGPYYVEAQDTQELRLARNDRFWGRGDEAAPRPFLETIVFTLRKDDVTAELDFRKDDRYVYRSVGPAEAERLREDVDFEVLDRGVSGWCLFFWLNQNPSAPWGKTSPKKLELFENVAFRRALAHAVDRGGVIRRAFKGFGEPLYGPVSPVYRWAAGSDVLREVTPNLDPKAATAELAALGVVPGEPDADGKRWLTYDEGGKRTPLEIEIRTSKDDEDRRRKTAEELKTQLEAIGVRVKVVEEPFGDMVMRLDKTYDYEAAVMFLEGSPDAAVLKFFFESSGPMHFVNPYQKSPATDWERRVDEQFHLYASSADPTTRGRALLDLQKTWSAAQPAFHLLNDRRLVAVRRDYEVNGLALTGRGTDPVLQRTVIENVRLRRLVNR
jgi:peptide/nickel transport system substrate-binding protein